MARVEIQVVMATNQIHNHKKSKANAIHRMPATDQFRSFQLSTSYQASSFFSYG
jgi:hypothetical protein